MPKKSAKKTPAAPVRSTTQNMTLVPGTTPPPGGLPGVPKIDTPPVAPRPGLITGPTPKPIVWNPNPAPAPTPKSKPKAKPVSKGKAKGKATAPGQVKKRAGIKGPAVGKGATKGHSRQTKRD